MVLIIIKFAFIVGLRSVTQVIGCGVALYLISPKMTGLMLIVVPTIIGTGTFLGSILRKMSKAAQAQVKNRNESMKEFLHYLPNLGS